ncbi:unnamed protein product, partial [Rotaria sp. Silwood1]
IKYILEKFRCEVAFPRAPGVRTQQSTYDLQLSGGSAGGYEQSHQDGHEHAQASDHIEVIAEPSEVNLGRGEEATITCRVNGADQYKVTWGKYAHDTSLPNYAHVCINC